MHFKALFGPVAELELFEGTIQARPYSGLTCIRVQQPKAAKTLAI